MLQNNYIIYNYFMEIIIKINELTNKKELLKSNDGVSIFNKIKKETSKVDIDNSKEKDKKITLDFAGISSCNALVFKNVISNMKAKLNGLYVLEIKNGNIFINQSFKMAFK